MVSANIRQWTGPWGVMGRSAFATWIDTCQKCNPRSRSNRFPYLDIYIFHRPHSFSAKLILVWKLSTDGGQIGHVQLGVTEVRYHERVARLVVREKRQDSFRSTYGQLGFPEMAG